MLYKRILWLFNHSTLIKSEVPILLEMGYEVYVPKIPPFDVSISVDWSLDNELTIPKDVLDVLNKVNFYDMKISREVMNLLNEYFDIAIFGIFIEPLKSLISYFKGILILHPFGLWVDELSYTSIIQSSAGMWLLNNIEKLGNRFWFGQSYENLAEIECNMFKRRSVYLPIGLKDNTIIDKWKGSKKKVLFVCSRIKMNSFSYNVYQKFRNDFEGIPYSIGGVQPIPLKNDSSVLGYLPQNEYDNLYPSHSVMFYHSQAKRHVHYHPFEAIKCGLPLIFMAGGLLDSLGGRNLPGRCKTIKEARKKCKRILNGDIEFSNFVRESQGVLLEKMSYEYCKKIWISSMTHIEKMSIFEKNNEERIKKIGILLPAEYTGGVLDYTLRLTTALKRTANKLNYKIDIVLGHLDHPNFDRNSNLKRIENLKVPIRRFVWEVVGRDRINEIYEIKGLPGSATNELYCMPNDNIRYFEDCDFLLFTADRVPENLFTTKPYGVIVHDYIQRYLPDMLGEHYERPFINLVRDAEIILTTTLNAKNDCINYAGVNADKIELLPLFFDEIVSKANIFIEKTKYFLWSTNTSPHKNHKVALEALSKYYSEGGNLACYITGVNTELFKTGNDEDKSNYVKEISNIINNDRFLKRNIKIFGNLPKNNYIQLLQNACYFLHPGYGDNGNGTAFDAAMLGVPTLSSRYPAMENMNSTMSLGFTFFDKFNSDDLEKKMQLIEASVNEIKNLMPKKDKLKQFTIEDDDICYKIFDTIISNIF